MDWHGAAVASAPTLNLADMAGTWNVKGTNEKGDSTLVTYTLTATVTTQGAQNKDTNCMAFQVNSVGQQTSYNSTSASNWVPTNATTGCW